MASLLRHRPIIVGASMSVSGPIGRLNEEQRELDARRRTLHDERRYNEENGFYGR